MKKIVLCGGGTAGHVFPALAVAEKLKDYEIHFIGSDGIEKDIIKKYNNIKFHEIPTVKLERKLTTKNLLIPIRLYKSIKSAKKILKEISPDVIFSKGGYVSVPVVIAGKKLKIKIISHESDLSFGLANKIILKLCDTMCTTFSQTAHNHKKCIYTGQPIRQKIFEGHPIRFGFNNSHPTILVLGGSLGAKFLNQIIFENLDKLTESYNIIHISGKNNFQEIKHENYYIIPFADNIEDYYKSADIAISRAGSGVINELLALEKPTLLIPLSKKCSRGDQIENAKLFTELGYSLMLEEKDYSIELLLQKLEYLTKNIQKFKKNMKKTAKNHAVDEIIKLL